MHTTQPAQTPALPSAYPLSFSVRISRFLAGGSILLSLAALCVLWPLLATDSLSSYDEFTKTVSAWVSQALDTITSG